MKKYVLVVNEPIAEDKLKELCQKSMLDPSEVKVVTKEEYDKIMQDEQMYFQIRNTYSPPKLPEFYPKKPKVYIPKNDSPSVIAAKGLQQYIINGEKILAHNEREAQKRYKSRHK